MDATAPAEYPVAFLPTGQEQVYERFGLGGRTPAERALGAMTAADYAALVLVDGRDADDPLFHETGAIRLATDFFLARKPIAALGHGVGLLVRAGLVRERMLTSWPDLAEEITAAGGTWHDCPVVVCLNGPNVLVTGRGLADMSEFCDAVAEQVARTAGRPSDAGAR